MAPSRELDPDMQAFLRAFEHRTPCDPNPEILALVDDDQPADLKALLDTYARRNGGMAIHDHMFEAWSCDHLADIVASLDPGGNAKRCDGLDRLDLEKAIVIAQTGDGEVFHAAAWADGDDHMTIVRFCVAGYANDGYRVTGTFMETLRNLATDVEGPDDLDDALHDLLGLPDEDD